MQARVSIIKSLMVLAALVGLLGIFDGFTAVVLWPLIFVQMASMGLGRHWLLSLLRTLLLFFLLMALWSYRVEGVVLGDGFFVHANFNTVTFMGFYPEHAWVTIATLVLHVFIEIQFIKGPALWRIAPKRMWGFTAVLVGALWLSPMPHFYEKMFAAPEEGRALLSLEQARKTLKKNEISTSQLFQDISNVTMKKQRNVLMFYLESVEAQYLNEERFPGLMPFLTELREISLFFSDFRQNRGAFTISGFFASQCGYPFEIFSSEQEMNKTLFYRGTQHLTCFGDVLAQMGYRQMFAQGTSLDFAGTRNFFQSHGYKEVMGSEELTGSAKPYAVLRDKPLYDRVFTEIQKRHQSSAPYHVASINFDTHDPGHSDKSCAPYGEGDNAILNAVHCLDQNLRSLFGRLQAEQMLGNTLVVFLSDHLAMTRLKNVEGRRNLLLIHEPNMTKGRTIPQAIYHHDVPKILFDVLGVGNAPYYPLAFSPLSEKERAHHTKADLVKALSRVFETRRQDRLPCDAAVSFHHKKNRFTYNERPTYFSPGHGVLTWPRDRIAVIAVEKSGNILFKELVHASDVMLRLTHPQIHRVLLWGYLDQLDVFDGAEGDYGYFWGQMDEPKRIRQLVQEGVVEERLTCGPSQGGG
tara:strand:- start:755 stop:2665 length:1911 start_codon:yes stop_codon:yes gene_type:complete